MALERNLRKERFSDIPDNPPELSDKLLRIAQWLESSRDMGDQERELGLQLRVFTAEHLALLDLIKKQRQKPQGFFLRVVFCALVVLEIFAICYLFWNHELSSTTFRYVLLPLSVLVAFFIPFVLHGIRVLWSLRPGMTEAYAGQFQAIEWVIPKYQREMIKTPL